MNGASGIAPRTIIGDVNPARGMRPSVPLREFTEREMLARLFGQTDSEPVAVSPSPAAGAGDDDAAPHLGRHVDVTA